MDLLKGKYTRLHPCTVRFHCGLLFLQVTFEKFSGGKREQSQPEWHVRTQLTQEKDKVNNKDSQVKSRVKENAAQSESLPEDFERTPSGRVRRRSAQVAVFHLQEIAEDELAKDWGTKRRIKDDLVPDSKRVREQMPYIHETQTVTVFIRPFSVFRLSFKFLKIIFAFSSSSISNR